MRQLTEEELNLAAKRKPVGAAYLRRKYAERRKRQAEEEQKQREVVHESKIKYTSPPTPGELLDAALQELDAVTDENFREKVQTARGLVAQANNWIGSYLMFAREPQGKND